jgi:DNA-binding GntR family transcriptional regulator
MSPGDGSSEGDAGIINADAVFHNDIVALTGLPRLMESYSRIRDQIQIMLMSGQLMRRDALDSQLQRHAALYDKLAEAIQSGDSTAILDEIDFHIRGGMLLKEFPTFTGASPDVRGEQSPAIKRAAP